MQRLLPLLPLLPAGQTMTSWTPLCVVYWGSQFGMVALVCWGLSLGQVADPVGVECRGIVVAGLVLVRLAG